ncbi:hypothetical protein XU18_2569 [Perkinsela sp. CCAP 1560/4]|nr:L1Tc-like protein [Perkinsela sp. CCAP 1560/4]KNH06548.1 hypothetical protein XU18_2569 [Perkinsela sp. CCAP 1560/4]|eukprot:KNH03750.1 L1Tc-like protein [Perkinsela sp. CCAP 1560/4]
MQIAKEACKTVPVCGSGCSSFRSECLARHAGLARVVIDRTLSRGQRLLIASDSQSLLMALRRHTACSTSGWIQTNQSETCPKTFYRNAKRTPGEALMNLQRRNDKPQPACV